MSEMKHSVSYERLAHYKCGKCRKWWTIGDARNIRNVSCPHCRHHDKVVVEVKGLKIPTASRKKKPQLVSKQEFEK
jgi:DNA-directed RNA polymerase subunit RPC12/RpoP